MQFIIQNSDNTLINQVLDPSELTKVMVRGKETFDTMKQMQKITDDNGKWQLGRRVSGGVGAVKVVARFPESALITLMQLEPNLLKDKKTFYSILKKYPVYAAYSRKAEGGAA